MDWQQIIKDYFSFTRRDRIGILFILAILILVLFLPPFMSRQSPKPVAADSSWIAAMKKIELRENGDGKKSYAEDNTNFYTYDRPANDHQPKRKGELFYFDPNTLSAEGWERLGFRDKTIQTIQNYLNKGGHFKKAEDLQKIYGLFPGEYERIASYIKIEPAGINNYNDIREEATNETPSLKTYTLRYPIVDINSGDTTAFIALPGIGSKLAARIVNFRDKLGGFYSIEQVKETFGLPDTTFQKIKQYLKLENTAVRKININTATLDELKAHPYLKWSIANPIVAYRTQHGPFSQAEDIKKVMALTNEVYNKVAPYLITQ